jgi:hypothetical protein
LGERFFLAIRGSLYTGPTDGNRLNGAF